MIYTTHWEMVDGFKTVMNKSTLGTLAQLGTNGLGNQKLTYNII
jgi:hypothetical protein